MKFTSEDITKDELVQEFFERVMSKATRRQYILAWKDYCNWKGQLPTEFIEEADIEQNQNIKLKKRKLKKDLVGYINYLKEQKKSQNTIYGYLKCVKAIYRDNDIVLPPKLPMSYGKDEKIKNGIERLPTLEDVRKLYNAGLLRDKAVILLQLSSGLGASEVRHLTYHDFAQALKLPIRDELNIRKDMAELKEREDYDLIGRWSLHRYKTAVPFNTFNSPESTRAIIDYIEWRERKNRRRVESYEHYLITSHYNRKLDVVGFNGIYARLNDKVGFKRRSNKYRFLTSHQLREIFTSTLFRNRVDKLRVDFLVGHRINNQDSAYFRANHEDLLQDYLKCLPHLTLENLEIKSMESEEYREVTHKLKEIELATGWIMDAVDKDPEVREAILNSAKKGIVKPPKELLDRD